MTDPRDFHPRPVPEGEPFELAETTTPRFGVGPDGVDNLRRSLRLPEPLAGGELGDPEAKW